MVDNRVGDGSRDRAVLKLNKTQADGQVIRDEITVDRQNAGVPRVVRVKRGPDSESVGDPGGNRSVNLKVCHMEHIQGDVETIDTGANDTRIVGPCGRIVSVNGLVGLTQAVGGANFAPSFGNPWRVREGRTTILPVGHVVEVPSHNMAGEEGEQTNSLDLVDSILHRRGRGVADIERRDAVGGSVGVGFGEEMDGDGSTLYRGAGRRGELHNPVVFTHSRVGEDGDTPATLIQGGTSNVHPREKMFEKGD